MLTYLLKNSDWSNLLTFISPNLLRVISPLTLLELGAELNRNTNNHEEWKKICSEWKSDIHPDSIILAENLKLQSNPKYLRTKDHGESVLQLFFFQLLAKETWLLDFRSSTFSLDGSIIRWHPKPYYYSPTPRFILGLRQLYQGFYHQDESRFNVALKDLNLFPARDSIMAHFGEEDQSKVQFRLKTFQATFSQIFTDCSKTNTKIPKDFIALGLMLLSLYENLEQIDSPFDVRSAFLQAEKNAT